MSLSVMAEKLYSRFILCFSNVSFLLLGFTIFGKFTTRAEFQSITRSGNKTVDETRDPMTTSVPPTSILDSLFEVCSTNCRSLNEPIYYSNQFWSSLFIFLTFHELIQNFKFKCKNIHCVESQQTLFGLILYGFIKRMDGYDPSPRFKIQYCLVYILIPMHYFAVLSIL